MVEQLCEKFQHLRVQPRYSIDDLATPSLAALENWFTNNKYYSFHLQSDTDVIMACTFDDFTTAQQQKHQNVEATSKVIRAALSDVDEVVQLIGAAFEYGDKLDWLHYKITNQIKDPQTGVYATVDDSQQHSRRQLTSVVIVNSPDGLPNLIHINVCGTHPDHQRKGLGMVCLSQALKMELTPNQTAYLEVYDEIKHAQRMYERIGFKVKGTLEYSTATLPH